MNSLAEITRAAALGALIALATGCGDDNGTTGPPSGPTTGTIAVAASTTGADMDSDGYLIILDGTEKAAIGSNGSVDLTSVNPGDRSVALSGVAENCSVGGEHPRSVSVTAGATTQAAFEVSCVATTGSIQVTTATTGEGTDPDGYLVTVDAGPGEPIGATQTLTIQDIPVGNRLVELTEMASNCTVTGENPTTAAVPLGGSATVSFDVSCTAPPPGTIAFISSRDGPQNEVYVMDGAGGGVTRLTDMAEPKHPPTARLSPDGTQVLFAAGEPADLWVVNADGTGLLRLTESADWSLDYYSASWSPDGTLIAYSDDPGLWIMNPDGSGKTLLSDLGAYDISWAPDGDRILFTGYDPVVCCDLYMWVISKDGTGLAKLTDQFVYRKAQWSPTGTQIAYLLDGPDLWVMNADGTDPTLVATDAWRISWAPDGSLIAFAGQGLETVRPDGSDRRQVVDMIIDPDNGYPYWSPGASTIAFVSYPNEVLGEPRDVYTVSPDGTGLTNITSHPAADEIGSWGP